MQTRSLLILVLYIPALLFGDEEEKGKNEPPREGNFSVPLTSQIAPLIGFGQLLVGKDALLPEFAQYYTRSEDGYTDILLPSAIYGITDDFSVTLFVPYTPKSRENGATSSGIKDTILQLEYGYYSKTTKTYTLQGTLVGNVQFPTGSSNTNPATGNGSYSYLVGTTFAYLSVNWYAFISLGADLTTTHHGTKFGNSYLYQWGLARYIKSLSPKGWICDLLVEFDGTYSEKDRIQSVTNSNSGGNVLFITPSLWLSSKHWIFQWGVGFPIVQDLNGHQDKILYSLAYNLGFAWQF